MRIKNYFAGAAMVTLMGMSALSFAGEDQMTDAVKDEMQGVVVDQAPEPLRGPNGGVLLDAAEIDAAGMIDDNKAAADRGVMGVVQDHEGGLHVVKGVSGVTMESTVNREGNPIIVEKDIKALSIKDVPQEYVADCPTGTTHQPDNSCLITGNYMGYK